MKMRWLHANRDRGATFFTGTPVANSMLELFVLQLYLVPERLDEFGMGSPDAWARWCVEFAESLQVAPDGQTTSSKYGPHKFKNVYELLMLFNEAADIRTKEQLGLRLPPLTRTSEPVPR